MVDRRLRNALRLGPILRRWNAGRSLSRRRNHPGLARCGSTSEYDIRWKFGSKIDTCILGRWKNFGRTSAEWSHKALEHCDGA